MNGFLRAFCCLSLLGFSTVAAAGDDFVFNVGMDAQWRSMPLHKGFGDNLVKKRSPQGAVYGSIKFNDLFGLEVGYQRSVLAHRKEVLANNGVSHFGTGLAITSPDYYISRTKVSTQGFYTGVLGLLPISEEYRLKFIASVGVVRMKTKIASALDFYDIAGGITTINDVLYSFTQTKWIPKVGAGVQHMINDRCGVRALATWEQTSKFNRIVGLDPTGVVPNPAKTRFASLKNSTTLGLGLFYNFK